MKHCWVGSEWVGERVLCEAYFWMAGTGTEAERAWLFLLHPSGQTLKYLPTMVSQK